MYSLVNDYLFVLCEALQMLGSLLKCGYNVAIKSY